MRGNVHHARDRVTTSYKNAYVSRMSYRANKVLALAHRARQALCDQFIEKDPDRSSALRAGMYAGSRYCCASRC